MPKKKNSFKDKLRALLEEEDDDAGDDDDEEASITIRGKGALRLLGLETESGGKTKDDDEGGDDDADDDDPPAEGKPQRGQSRYFGGNDDTPKK